MEVLMVWLGLDCMYRLLPLSSMAAGATQAREKPRAEHPWGRPRGLKVIGSSTKVHVVDALAITGDEGRGSLRKAAGSWQTSIDPQMSEWGNPTLA